MRRIFIRILCFLLACVCLKSCAQPVDHKPITKNIGKQLVQPDSIVIANLGEEICDILFSPENINVYTLETKSKVEEGDYETEPHFIRKDFVGNLDKNFFDVIGFILLSNNDCYTVDSIVVQTFYLPIIEFEYKKKKKTASVIISPNNGTWTVVSEDKRKFNYNYKNQQLITKLVNKLQNISLGINNNKNHKK